MVKIILQLYPVLPAASEEERAALRPIGRNREIYHETLLGWHDIIKAADEMGLWGAATIEHHFWSEGYEVGPNPGVLNAYWAAITKKIRVGQMGYVMSTQNPLRVAEETAILDHLANGRFFVGFAQWACDIERPEDMRVRDAVLESLMKDSDPRVRTQAISLIEPVEGDSSVREVLHTVAMQDESPQIRTASRQVLQQLPEIQ